VLAIPLAHTLTTPNSAQHTTNFYNLFDLSSVLSCHQVYPAVEPILAVNSITPSSLSCRRVILRRAFKQQLLVNLQLLRGTTQIRYSQKCIAVLLSRLACSRFHPAINPYHSIKSIHRQVFPAVEPPNKNVLPIFHSSTTLPKSTAPRSTSQCCCQVKPAVKSIPP
jgi:hypothetical protein